MYQSENDLLKIAKALGRLFKDISEIEQDIEEVQEEIGAKVKSYNSVMLENSILRIDEINAQTLFPMGAGD